MPWLEIHYTANNDLKLFLSYCLPSPAAKIISLDSVYNGVDVEPQTLIVISKHFPN